MKVYTKMYNDNYASIAKASPALVVLAGKMKCFAIPFPSEGYIEQIVIRQKTSESQFAASVELLNSKIPFPVGSYNTGTASTDIIDHYRIIPSGIAVVSNTSYVSDENDFGRAFRNIDGGFTNNQRYVYLVISPTAAGTDTTWNVTLECRTDVG